MSPQFSVIDYYPALSGPTLETLLELINENKSSSNCFLAKLPSITIGRVSRELQFPTTTDWWVWKTTPYDLLQVTVNPTVDGHR